MAPERKDFLYYVFCLRVSIFLPFCTRRPPGRLELLLQSVFKRSEPGSKETNACLGSSPAALPPAEPPTPADLDRRSPGDRPGAGRGAAPPANAAAPPASAQWRRPRAAAAPGRRGGDRPGPRRRLPSARCPPAAAPWARKRRARRRQVGPRGEAAWGAAAEPAARRGRGESRLPGEGGGPPAWGRPAGRPAPAGEGGRRPRALPS